MRIIIIIIIIRKLSEEKKNAKLLQELLMAENLSSMAKLPNSGLLQALKESLSGIEDDLEEDGASKEDEIKASSWRACDME